MRLLSLATACLALAPLMSWAAEAPEHFRFYRDIERGAAQEEEIVAFTLDGDIYAAARDGLPDLRIFDNTQVEIPYQIEPDVEYREEQTRNTFAAEVVSLREEQNAIEIRLRLPEKSPAAEGLSFSTPLSNYERKLQVFGSNDGTTWVSLAADAVIFDYSRYMNVGNHEVALPSNAFRQFKVVVEDVTDEKQSPYMELTRVFRGGKEDERVEQTKVQRRPFHIDQITAWHVVTRQHVQKTKRAAYPVSEFEVQEDSGKKQTILQVTTRREPITSFTLAVSSRNYSRRAVVEVPQVQGVVTQWRQIGQATVANLHFRDFNREQLTIDFPEQRRETYRIIIDNEDNPPLEISGVKSEGNVYRAIFLAAEAKTYRVFYGSETAESPKYEASTVLSALRRDFQSVETKLGSQVENAAFAGESGTALLKPLNNWIFLGAAIALMVAVLAYGLFRAGRRLEDLPKE
jgi:hypothetical protein